jgi:hypothetical protein
MLNNLPAPLAPLVQYDQFILWTIRDDKKFPIDYRSLQVCNAHDPAVWLSFDQAVLLSSDIFHVGFVFTASDPFFFLDIDSCLIPAGWSPLAVEIITALPGAAVEISQSGRGLHIFGRYSGACPPHGCKNIALGLELYHEGRFVALTGTSAQGSAETDCTAVLAGIINKYFHPSAGVPGAEWTSAPCQKWQGITDDNELITRAIASTSAGATFGGKASFRQLWEADPAALGLTYPDPSGMRPYDFSSADAALAQHLAFWTGKNCERIRTLMLRSALRRDKWNREDYLPRTILRACSLQQAVYGIAPANKLKASSDTQRNYAEKIREAKLAVANEEQKTILTAPAITAKFWIDNQEKSLADLCALRTTPDKIESPLGDPEKGPQTITGYQYLSGSLQLEHFKGCVYIQNAHKIFTPDGQLLKPEQFNATYGGYIFQLDDSGEKITRKAWEAFTESQIIRYPKVTGSCFRPLLPPGALVNEEGKIYVNTYVPVPTRQLNGDPGPFLNLLSKILPNERDRKILLAYMAACIQHAGIKFQWAPLLQGVEGNGKTILTWCVAAAVGNRYTHMPPASEIHEKFNEWLFGKLFIGVEDVYVANDKREMIEILKPMITNNRLSMRAMQQSQVMGDNCANFMLNSNYRDAIKKTRDTRRFCIFYTAQQAVDDLKRDGMSGDYFPKLYNWLRSDGYAIVNYFLRNYKIPDELNPATNCHRAPETSTTKEALVLSLGSIEQEIMEAIDEERPGFAGGWISSVAIDRLLQEIHAGRIVPPNKRRELLQSVGYDWHPALNNGRVNNPIMIDGGKKPRLFIKADHLYRNLTDQNKIAIEYQKAQGVPISNVENIFAERKI